MGEISTKSKVYSGNRVTNILDSNQKMNTQSWLPLIVVLLHFVCGALLEPTPIDISKWKGKRVLFISAHPDDIEASAGGLIAQLTKQQTQVYFTIVTNGDKGCFNPICANWTSSQIATQRSIEAHKAAQTLGVPNDNVIMLGYEDSMVTSYPEIQIKTSLIATIRRVKPDVIMSWYPYPQLDLLPSQWQDLGFHPDHQAVGRFALETHMTAGLRLLMPELGAAWSVSEYYMWAFKHHITDYVDISSTLNTKHQTQYNNASLVKEMLTALGNQVATNCEVSGLTFAEAFTRYF